MLTFLKIAIVGASGNVGQTLLKLLANKNVPANQLYLLGSEKSAGQSVAYQDQILTINLLSNFDFKNVDIAFFAAGSNVAAEYAPKAAEAGCYVIDKSSYYRLKDFIPLIVPEVNGDLLKKNNSKIISVPNCSTIQLVMALKPLHDLAEIERVEVATYQAVSGAGKTGSLKLQQEMMEFSATNKINTEDNKMPFAFNVVPKIDVFLEHGFTKEEMKLHEETQKILSAKNIIVNATAVRVPVWQGHSEAVHIKTKKPVSLLSAKEALKNFSGIQYCSEEIPMPATHAAENEYVWVGRMRRHPSDSENYLNFWVVADNLYKGAAWNAIQIAELLSEKIKA